MERGVGLDAALHNDLQQAREALVWKLDGLSEYDLRRPMVPTGTNLLGLVKHVAIVDGGYLGVTFGRPLEELERWFQPDVEANADMWATAEEGREQIVNLYHRVWAHSDQTVEQLGLNALGRVPWWSDAEPVSVHRILVHVIAETNCHAGQADIICELIDGGAGWRRGDLSLPSTDAAGWRDYRARVEEVALQASKG